MSSSPTIMVEVGKPGFIHLLLAQILFRNESNWIGVATYKNKWISRKNIWGWVRARAYAVIHGVEVRGERGNYTTQPVKFNSNPAT
jgi:hypothetical protein